MKMTCCECQKNYEGKPLPKIPRGSPDTGNSHIGICAECLEAHFEFSRKSLDAHNAEKVVKKVRKKLKR